MDQNLIRALLHHFAEDEYRPSLGIAHSSPFAGVVTPRQVVDTMQSLQALGIITKHPETSSKNSTYRLTPAGAALRAHLDAELAEPA